MIDAPTLQPLYSQVREIIVRRIVGGVWRPGQALPSEQALAAELGVSQGTVRKALNEMTAENLLVRHHGKGTFVAEHTQQSALFRFFRIARQDGRMVTPEGGGEIIGQRLSRALDREKLGLGPGSRVIEMARTRSVDGKPAIRERIVLPSGLFPGLEKRAQLPNTLYALYQTDYGINIVTAHEMLTADLADADDRSELGVEEGSPILCVDRVAVSLENRKVEWRVSRFPTSDLVYAVTIR